MASRTAKPTHGPDETITRGSGNVFADLGYPDAEERQMKLRLAHAINVVIARRRLTQAAAAEKLGVNQPKVSALVRYQLDGFSVERLMGFLTALDQDVEIVIQQKPRSRATARIWVVAREADSIGVRDLTRECLAQTTSNTLPRWGIRY
jgi:predicted XRE-type DNA-binding protein